MDGHLPQDNNSSFSAVISSLGRTREELISLINQHYAESSRDNGSQSHSDNITSSSQQSVPITPVTAVIQSTDHRIQLDNRISLSQPSVNSNGFRNSPMTPEPLTRDNSSSLLSRNRDEVDISADRPPHFSTSHIAFGFRGGRENGAGHRIPSSFNSQPSIDRGNSRINRTAEMRELFAPYDQSQSRRMGQTGSIFSAGGRRRQRALAHRQAVANPVPLMETEMFAFRLKSSIKSPAGHEKSLLTQEGLGYRLVQIRAHNSAATVEQKIREAYPILGTVPFELMRASRGGRGAPLVPISADHRIPIGVNVLGAVNRGNVCYVRPLEDILDFDESNDDLEDQNYRPPSSTQRALRARRQNCPSAAQRVEQVSERIDDNGDNGNESQRETSVGYPAVQIESNQSTSVKEPTMISDFDIPKDVYTMDELRNIIYNSDETRQNFPVRRENFLTTVLEAYKDPLLNIFRRPFVIFEGEQGVDEGAVTRELFRLAYQDVVTQTIPLGSSNVPLFEGQDDRRVPVCNIRLIRNGTFKSVGKLLVHAAIHVGISLPGLSPAVAHYLCSPSDDVPSDILTVDDIPDFEVKKVVESIHRWDFMIPDEDGRTLEAEVANLASAAGWGRLEETDKDEIQSTIIYHHVIGTRKSELDVIKSVFLETGLTNFIDGRQVLIEALFPSLRGLVVSKDVFFRQIRFSGRYERVKKFLEEFVFVSDSGPSLVTIGQAKNVLASGQDAGFVSNNSYPFACALKTRLGNHEVMKVNTLERSI